jgi:hypothetical protein
MHASFFLLQLHFNIFVLTYSHIMQILHFASVFITKGVIFCFISIQPPFKVFLNLRYKMLVPQANLKCGFYCNYSMLYFEKLSEKSLIFTAEINITSTFFYHVPTIKQIYYFKKSQQQYWAKPAIVSVNGLLIIFKKSRSHNKKLKTHFKWYIKHYCRKLIMH